MGDTENNSQPSKKRAAGVQLSRDNPGLDDNEETSELEPGTFKKASEEVLATRRIVKVRRQPTLSGPAPPASSNPFAALRLVPSGQNQETDELRSKNNVDEQKCRSTAEEEVKTESKMNDDSKAAQSDETSDGAVKSPSEVKNNALEESTAQKDEIADGTVISPSEVTNNATEEPNAQKDKTSDGSFKSPAEVENNVAEGDNSESKDIKDEENNEKKENTETAAPFSSFKQLSSGQNAFSGITGTGFSSTSFSFGLLPKEGGGTSSLFGLGDSINESSPIFSSSVGNTVTKSEGSKFPPMQEVSVETGEENEKAVFTADSALFEFIDGCWKERGKGELKINVPTGGTSKARLVMRARGNYRLLLNANLFPDMKLTGMEKKGVTFACVNSAGEGRDGLSTFALKFRDASFVQEFQAAVMENKGKSGLSLKTPDNSPKASDE